MALPTTSNFTATDGALHTQIGTFSVVRGLMQVRGNAAQSNSSSDESCVRNNTETFNNDQYAFMTVTLLTGSLFIGVAVRCSNTLATYYGYYWDANDRYFFKMVNGTFTDLVTPQTGVSNTTGNVLRIEADGTTITAFVNGVQDGSFSTTDGSIASGWGGLCGWGQAFASDTSGDTWEAGDLGVVVQYAYPVSDVTDGAWTTDTGGTDLFSAIDEVTFSDADFIKSDAAPGISSCKVRLGALSDPASSSGHILEYRFAKSPSDGAQVNLTVTIMEGGTVIASQTHTNISSSFTTGTLTLSGAEADAITNYGILDVVFEKEQV